MCVYARLILFVEAVTTQDGAHVIGDIVALIDTIHNHAFGYINDLRRYLVQHAHDSTLVAVVCIVIGNECKQLIGKFLLVCKETKDIHYADLSTLKE